MNTPGKKNRLRQTVVRAGLGLVGLLALFGLTLAIPVETWRTGQQFSAPLPVLAPSELPAAPHRIWVDADPACGKGPRVDPDDCIALWYLMRETDVAIAGVSTVFGNASLDVTDAITRDLVPKLQRRQDDVPVYRGADAPLPEMHDRGTEAEHALIDALATDELTIVALGPLTNIAAALQARPDLRDRIQKIIAVMGRRPGHIFHPAEGSGEGTLLGHGPVFRDFNVAQDPDALRVILDLDIPLVLLPYEAAREVEIDEHALASIASNGDGGRWVAQRAQSWLRYWKTDIGRNGFYPFDLMAAMFVAEPTQFDCARVYAELRQDPTLFFPFSRLPSLLIEPIPTDDNGSPAGALYCHGLRTTSRRVGDVTKNSPEGANTTPTGPA
ncbi:nucleoside hydrolase [Marinobacter sp. 71-i]|uniref:Nucleoside hydrolase n=1 Tax=Marinobacter iranensis TaxID=2962607 RepID=A0ABT5YAM6_9GAMM|nr:nucleoside hydrolase [Marinobacter iranensis]MDF0750733.1 nucleoside hydrolase [Marinobacter iranensis]